MKQRQRFKKLIAILCLVCVAISNLCTISVFAGGVYESLSDESKENAEKLYKYLIANGYSKECAFGILGNVDQESTFLNSYNSASSAPYGFFQMTSQWSTFKSWASSEGLDYTDITVQMRYVEESEFANASVYNAYVSSPTYEEVKITTDITTAVEAFMAAYERCTGGSYEVTKITLKGSNRKYQDGEKRIQFANNLAENMGNIAIDSDGSSSDGSDGATENADGSTTTSSGMVVINNVYYTEEELSAYRKLGEMNIDEQYLSDATRNNLGVEDLDAVTNWQNNVNSIQKESGIVSVIRKITQLLGILLTIYVIFIYIAYWFDRLNNFLDIDLLKILTFGKFMISEDEDSCTYKTKDFGDGKTKTVNHRAILTICVIGLVFATLIMTGTLYTLIMKLVMFIRHKIGG